MSYILFAQWFGVISAILALGILSNLDDAKNMAKNMIKTETGYIMGGVLPIIFGSLAMIEADILHTIDYRQLIIAMIGLTMLLAGAYRVLFVNHWQKLLHRHLDQIPSLFSLFGLMFAVLLLYVGFFSHLIR